MVTCRELAIERLRSRSIQEDTYGRYLETLDKLGLSDLPADEVHSFVVTSKLRTILNPGTRRKHIINIRACLGLSIPIPKVEPKTYDLPAFQDLVDACKGTHEMYGLVMLFGGLRLGEACLNQRLTGHTLVVDRQRNHDGSVTASKTSGPVVLPLWLAERYQAFDFNLSHSACHTGVKRMMKRAGYKLGPHALRHAFATQLVSTGASPEVLRRQMRHTNVATSLKFYVQTTDQDVTAAVARLGGIADGVGAIHEG